MEGGKGMKESRVFLSEEFSPSVMGSKQDSKRREVSFASSINSI